MTSRLLTRSGPHARAMSRTLSPLHEPPRFPEPRRRCRSASWRRFPARKPGRQGGIGEHRLDRPPLEHPGADELAEAVGRPVERLVPHAGFGLADEPRLALERRDRVPTRRDRCGCRPGYATGGLPTGELPDKLFGEG